MRNPALRVFKPMLAHGLPMYHIALVRDEAVPYQSPSVEISTPEKVAEVCADMRAYDREAFDVLCLNTKNRLICRVNIAVGSLNATIVHPREVFKVALAANSASIVVVHNHVTGEVTPSGADCALVRRLVRAGEQLGVDVLDSCIIGGGETDSICSMREIGMLG